MSSQPALKLTAPGKAAKKMNYEFTEPVYTRKLVEAMGSGVAVAEKLHLSGSTITTGIRNNKISHPIEIACQHFWEKEYAPKASKLGGDLLICQVPVGKEQGLREYVAFLGGTFWQTSKK